MGRLPYVYDINKNFFLIKEFLKYLQKPTGKYLDEKAKEAKTLSNVLKIIESHNARHGLRTRSLIKAYAQLEKSCQTEHWTRFLNNRNKQERNKVDKKNKKIVEKLNKQNEKKKRSKQRLEKRILKNASNIDISFSEVLDELDRFLFIHKTLPLKDSKEMISLLAAFFEELKPEYAKNLYFELVNDKSDNEKKVINNWLTEMDIFFQSAKIEIKNLDKNNISM
jgi:exonuclease VII large subunit